MDAFLVARATALIGGGVAVEGSANPSGDVVSAHLLRRVGDSVRREALMFHTSFAEGFAPVLFRDWLPRDLRRRAKPGEWVFEFFARWTQAWEAVRTADAKASFVASVAELSRRGEPVDVALASEGFLVWTPDGGVPA